MAPEDLFRVCFGARELYSLSETSYLDIQKYTKKSFRFGTT